MTLYIQKNAKKTHSKTVSNDKKESSKIAG